MRLFNNKAKVSAAQLNEICSDDNVEENKIIKRLNSLLSRKDIIDLESEKIDAVRMVLLHLEDNKDMSATRLVKFLKA